MVRRISHKIKFEGITFDSQTELFYYQHLLREKKNLKILDIVLQPVFEIIPKYIVQCINQCNLGKVKSPKTGREINCTKCRGAGFIERAAKHYTADFKVIYEDGRIEYIDVKGGPVERDFPLRKSLFESRYGQHLFVVRWNQVKGWIKE